MTEILGMKVTKLVMTCDAFPSQWDAFCEDGIRLYIRYRWGTLTVRIATPTTGDIEDLSEPLLEMDGRIDADGIMSTDEMLEHVNERTQQVT